MTLFFIVLIAFLVRRKFLDFQSGDYTDFLSPWYDLIKGNGGVRALKSNFSNYTSTYIYFVYNTKCITRRKFQRTYYIFKSKQRL